MPTEPWAECSGAIGRSRRSADCGTGMAVARRLFGRAEPPCAACGHFEEERGRRRAEEAGASGHRNVQKGGLVVLVLGAILGVATVGGGCAWERWSGRAKVPGRGSARAIEGPVVAPLPMRAGARLPLYGAQAVCHLTGEHFEPGPVSEDAVEEIDSRLRAELSKGGLKTVSQSSLAQWLARTEPELLFKYETSLGAEAARSTGADFALMGVVVRYEERSGVWWASAFPASVAFTLVLVEPATRNIVWSYRFDETQAPFWRRREPTEVAERFRSQEPLEARIYPLPWWDSLRWMTRRELAERGLRMAVRSLADFLRRPRAVASPRTDIAARLRACAPARGEAVQPVDACQEP